MNEEKNLKHKMATMAVLMSSLLSMIASARAETTMSVNSAPEAAVNLLYLVEMKGNTHFCITRRDYTRTDSEDLHNIFTNDHNIFTNDHITSQMITLPHKHLYIRLLVVFQISGLENQGGNEYDIEPS